MPTFHQGTQSNNIRAFTLVELIVVIAIVSVLSTVGFLTYSGYIKNGNDFKRLSDVAMIKTSLESYRKTNGLVYPTGSAATQIVDGSNPLASQYLFDETLCGKAGITTVPRDPKTKTPYLYSVSQDKTNYQVTATLQDDNNLVAMTPFVQTAAAADDGIAYVDGTFIPTNKLLFPGLLYAVTPGAVFNPSLTPSFDISTAQNKAKVILNGQRTNLAYGVPNGQMLAGSGITLEQVLASVSLVERGTSGVASSLCISVENGTSTYAAGENEVWPYMAGTSIGQQIGWKYKTCDWTSGNMQPSGTSVASSADFHFVCAQMAGATFSADCVWQGCANGYTPVQGASSGAPRCKTNLATPSLSYPSNGAYGLPTDGTLAWAAVSGSDGSYKVYLGTSNGTWDVVAWIATSSLAYTYSSLAAGTTYYWKVQACEAGNPSSCQISEVRSFTTAASGTNSNAGASNTTPNACPTEPEVPCVVASGSLTLSYMGCSNMDSANKDCALSQNNFGTSERDFRLSNGSDDDYFGYAKIASYRLDNASSGYAYFKVRIGQDSNRMTEQPSTDSFETNQAIDFGDDGIAKNLYWKYGAGCSVDSTRGYRVTGKSSCWINVYARSDPSWPTSIWNVGAFQVYNTDSTYGYWSVPVINLTGKGDLYTAPSISLAFVSSARQALETAGNGTAGNFGGSTRVGTGSYGYWKSLTYQLTNGDSHTTYFTTSLAGTWVFSGTNPGARLAPQTASNSPDDSSSWDASLNPGALYNLGADTGATLTPNFFMKNGDIAGANACLPSIPSNTGFRIPPGGNCQMTYYWRSDSRSPTGTPNSMLTLSLEKQPSQNNSYIDIAGAGFGWWIYFTNYAYSEMAGWIKLNLSIRDYNLPSYLLSGFGESETFWQICFSPSCGATVVRNWNTGQLSGYAWSEMLGWIDVSQTYLNADQTTSWYAWSEMLGWISFNP